MNKTLLYLLPVLIAISGCRGDNSSKKLNKVVLDYNWELIDSVPDGVNVNVFSNLIDSTIYSESGGKELRLEPNTYNVHVWNSARGVQYENGLFRVEQIENGKFVSVDELFAGCGEFSILEDKGTTNNLADTCVILMRPETRGLQIELLVEGGDIDLIESATTEIGGAVVQLGIPRERNVQIGGSVVVDMEHIDNKMVGQANILGFADSYAHRIILGILFADGSEELLAMNIDSICNEFNEGLGKTPYKIEAKLLVRQGVGIGTEVIDWTINDNTNITITPYN